MKTKFLLLFNAILTTILSMLGFSSCIGEDEYGCPDADYYAEGYVFDDEGNPIEGVKVLYGITWTYGGHEFQPSDSVYTDATGMFCTGFVKKGLSHYENTFIAEDPSGVYESDTLKDVTAARTKHARGWYEGEFKASVTLNMKKKK